ncbi:cytochrome b [Variovorax terrae]|uniref:Cytochrome b n=1 Tax=Variovorax terrae TaxID=2923278 RepID=A0A9X1VPW2_9BURK|nr:cytochrome b [Variovorax terrae]MCJ0761621.1 cytochrome b [Variovorax terrae]
MKTDNRYSSTAIAIHWLAALLIFGAIAMGVYMTSLQLSPTRLKLYNWHKWLGITILALSLVRVLWRATHRPPVDLPMPGWQRHAAHLTHWTLYALFLAVPLAGWTYSSASGFPVVVFGVLPLPDLVAPDRSLAEVLKALHVGLALALGAVIALHVAAVCKHQWLDRDQILFRMLPRVFGRQAP